MLPVVQDGKLVGLLSLDELKHKSPALAAMVFKEHKASGIQIRTLCEKKVIVGERWSTSTSFAG